ncbi:hypothetical protein [Bacillus cereus group sp. BfR-BA-01313]
MRGKEFNELMKLVRHDKTFIYRVRSLKPAINISSGQVQYVEIYLLNNISYSVTAYGKTAAEVYDELKEVVYRD